MLKRYTKTNPTIRTIWDQCLTSRKNIVRSFQKRAAAEVAPNRRCSARSSKECSLLRKAPSWAPLYPMK